MVFCNHVVNLSCKWHHLAEGFLTLQSLTLDDFAINIRMGRSLVPCNTAVSRLDGVAAIDKDAAAILRSVTTNGARDKKGLVVTVLINIDTAAIF